MVQEEARIYGFAPNVEECNIPASIGKLTGFIFDDDGRMTPALTFTAFLAHSDDVPFVIGFADVLDQYQLRCDYRTGVAYLDERLLPWGRRWLGWWPWG
jgi:hypothetical protein